MNTCTFIIELSSVAVLFLFCFIIVFGLKVFLIFCGITLKNPFKNKKTTPVPSLNSENRPKKKRIKFKTIVINPEESTKIYFKKPSD